MAVPEPKTRVELPVQGMHCAACVGKVERALRAVPGVEDASYAVPEEIERTPESEARDRAARASMDRSLLVKALVGAALSVPVLIGGMREIFTWAPAWLG